MSQLTRNSRAHQSAPLRHEATWLLLLLFRQSELHSKIHHGKAKRGETTDAEKSICAHWKAGTQDFTVFRSRRGKWRNERNEGLPGLLMKLVGVSYRSHPSLWNWIAEEEEDGRTGNQRGDRREQWKWSSRTAPRNTEGDVLALGGGTSHSNDICLSLKDHWLGGMIS